jgi:hypothetical protein
MIISTRPPKMRKYEQTVEVFAKPGCSTENPEKCQMKAHFLLSFVVYDIVPFYVFFIVHTRSLFFLRLVKNNLKKSTPLGLQPPNPPPPRNFFFYNGETSFPINAYGYIEK